MKKSEILVIASGILLVDKEVGSTSFHIVSLLRKLTKIKKIGHAGTLDPFATGVMVMLVGKEYTKKSDQFLSSEKTYRGSIHLGVTTDTYDKEGVIVAQSDSIPSFEEVALACKTFSGTISQVPPMFSAKKIGGKKLCDLARKGIVLERKPAIVKVDITIIHYTYPILEIEVQASKGTYIRSLAYDIGQFLKCGAHLSTLRRTRSGTFSIDECILQSSLNNLDFNPLAHLRQN